MRSISNVLLNTGASLILLLSIAASALSVPSAYAQSGGTDFQIPTLVIEKRPSGLAGEEQGFILRVTDDQSVASVKMYFRYSSNDSYTEVDLEPMESDSELYLASIPTVDIDSNLIQYYLIAEDAAGNLVQRGYSFSPLTLSLRAPASANSDSQNTQTSSSRRTILYVLGAIAAGAVVAAAASAGGGGGDSGDSGGCGAEGCVLTIGAPRP